MKKEYLYMTAWAIAHMLASCSADEPVAQNTTDGVISYNVVTANQTRAKNSYDNNHKPTEFKVWAHHSGQSDKGVYYIGGDIIHKVNDIYTAKDGIRYWPSSGTLSFYAVTDDNDKTIINDDKDSETYGKVIVKDYTIKDPDVTTTDDNTVTVYNNASQQLDLMYAVKADASHGANNTVSLNFRHALSQICFKAKNENAEKVTITIKSITVDNIASEGSYELPAASTPDNKGNWYNLGEKKYSYKITFESPIVLDNKVKNDVIDLSPVKKNDSSIDDISNILNLIPQTANSLTLTLRVDNNNTNNTSTKIFPLDNDKEYDDITIPLNTKWEEGNRYTYTLIFDKDWKDVTFHGIKYDIFINDFNYINIPIINNHEAVLMRNEVKDNDGKITKPALYFATTNIGADKPKDAGLFFWWGDNRGYEVETYKSDESHSYKTINGFSFTTTTVPTNKKKDMISAEYLDDDELKPDKDAAHVNWGGQWRMPTKDDLEWLANKDNCTWTKDVDSSGTLIGYEVKSIETKGTIYLPATGCFQDGANNDNQFKNKCWYWSKTIGEDLDDNGYKYHAYRLNAATDNINVKQSGLRYDGFPIRPVANSITAPSTESTGGAAGN